MLGDQYLSSGKVLHTFNRCLFSAVIYQLAQSLYMYVYQAPFFWYRDLRSFIPSVVENEFQSTTEKMTSRWSDGNIRWDTTINFLGYMCLLTDRRCTKSLTLRHKTKETSLCHHEMAWKFHQEHAKKLPLIDQWANLLVIHSANYLLKLWISVQNKTLKTLSFD